MLSIQIVPRMKGGDKGDAEPPVITLNEATIRSYFHMPLKRAARILKICVTTLKMTCRKLGIQNWPYRRIRMERRRNVMLDPNNKRTGPFTNNYASTSQRKESGKVIEFVPM